MTSSAGRTAARIAVNATLVDSEPTGLGVYTVNVVRELAHMLRPDDKLLIFTSEPRAFAEVDAEIVPVSRWAQARYGKPAGIYRFLWTQTVLPWRLREARIDVLYNPTHHGLPYVMPDIPQILTIQHDVEVTFAFPGQHRLQYHYFRRIVPRLIRASAGVVTTSAYTRDVLARVYRISGERLHFAHNSCDHRVFVPHRGTDDAATLARHGLRPGAYVLLVGATYPYRNCGVVLDAMDQAGADLARVDVCIAGYRREYLDRLLADVPLRVRDRLVALRHVPQSELAALYRGALCLVFPSLHESFGLPCVEAMACGCPVIASQASSLPEVCGGAAEYFEPRDVTTLVRVLREVALDPGRRLELRQRGLRRASDFTWQATAAEVHRVLEHAMCASRRGLPGADAARSVRKVQTL